MKENKTYNKIPKNLAFNNHILYFGYFGIKSCEFGNLTLNQIHNLDQSLEFEFRLNLKRRIKIWNRIIANLAFTKLNLETRMGKGKGPIKEYFSYIKPGQILFEIEKVPEQSIKKAFLKIQKRIGFKIKYITKVY